MMSQLTGGPACNCGRGFTLTEILVVLAIVGFAASIALPSLTSSDTIRLDLAAEEAADAMRYARSEAMRTGVAHGFRIDTATEQLRLFELDVDTIPPTENYTVYHPVAKKRYTVDLAYGLSKGTEFDTVQFVFAQACNNTTGLAFDQRGDAMCTDPVTSQMVSAQAVVRHRDLVRTLEIAALTGRVVVK